MTINRIEGRKSLLKIFVCHVIGEIADVQAAKIPLFKGGAVQAHTQLPVHEDQLVKLADCLDSVLIKLEFHNGPALGPSRIRVACHCMERANNKGRDGEEAEPEYSALIQYAGHLILFSFFSSTHLRTTRREASPRRN